MKKKKKRKALDLSAVLLYASNLAVTVVSFFAILGIFSFETLVKMMIGTIAYAFVIGFIVSPLLCRKYQKNPEHAKACKENADWWRANEIFSEVNQYCNEHD